MAADSPEWQKNREVQRLTKEILALQREAGAKLAAAVIAMGSKMRQIQAALEPGQWLAWLETAVPFDRRTIANYMRLSEWADDDPREVGRLEHLSPTKLYMLAPLAPERRRELTGRVPIVIPGHPRPKTVDVMTVAELGRVIGGLTTRPRHESRSANSSRACGTASPASTRRRAWKLPLEDPHSPDLTRLVTDGRLDDLHGGRVDTFTFNPQSKA